MTKALTAVLICLIFMASCTREQADSYLWLEEIDDSTALEWVNTQNQITLEVIQKYPAYEKLYTGILDILNSTERIAYPSIRGGWIYNFWQDENNARGVWRRCPLSEYLKVSPEWETVLDIDLLCTQENAQWAFKGAVFCTPDTNVCMVQLSHKGGDAIEMREFDLDAKTFVKEGFTVPSAKGSAVWINKDTLLISSDFGPGTTTNAGYPRIVKIWKRGTPLSAAKTLFEGKPDDVRSGGWVQNTLERQYILVSRAIDFYCSEVFALEREELVKLDIPKDARLRGFFQNQMLIELKSDWTIGQNTYQQGWLLGIEYSRFLTGSRDFDVIVKPDERSSLTSIHFTKNAVLIGILNNVRGELYCYTFNKNRWQQRKVPAPDYSQISITSADELSGQYFFTAEDFLTPRSLYYVSDVSGDVQEVKRLPHFFDSSNLQIVQREATSPDGTKIPYFLVYPQGIKYDGSNPTLLYGYGGFEVSLLPYYSPILGRCWLENGGVYALANIRGGGEFGPRWHQAALKENRQRAFDDFIAISEDLIRQKITSGRHLGIMGGSNGGLLVSSVFTQRPDLYNAVVCSVPLCDMKRYTKLLAGASWMGEYGDPDIPEQWNYLKRYSPYHNLTGSKQYPVVFFTTSTRDDRVHPGHARKMAAKMKEQGHEIFYFENTEGGHAAGVTNQQRALMSSLEFSYLLKQLKE